MKRCVVWILAGGGLFEFYVISLFLAGTCANMVL